MKGKNILIGITGGMAAYKMPEFCRLLIKSGASVRVISTKAGLKFVSPVVFEALTRTPLYYDPFAFIEGMPSHIFLGEWAEAVFVAPASADFLAKAACGMGDELLLSTLLATKSPVGLAPSMNWKMWEHGATQKNVAALKELGYGILEPDYGELACGEGKGRLPGQDKMLDFLNGLLAASE